MSQMTKTEEAASPSMDPQRLSPRKWYALSEETLTTELGGPADGDTLWKHAVAAVVQNPYAGHFSDNLDLLIRSSEDLGHQFGERLIELCGSRPIEGYGKAAIVGVDGEYEHGNALVTAVFADPIRERLGGGKAWIPSTGKRGGPGVTIDVPLANKDALYVRSHYDTYTLSFGDAPSPGEIVIIFAVATRGRLRARVGGLTALEVIGADGLR